MTSTRTSFALYHLSIYVVDGCELEYHLRGEAVESRHIFGKFPLKDLDALSRLVHALHNDIDLLGPLLEELVPF
jgi:hypothetical protein